MTSAITFANRRRITVRSQPETLPYLRSVDDLLQARHTQRYVHARNPGKVKGLQSHLSARLGYALRPDRSNCLSLGRTIMKERSGREKMTTLSFFFVPRFCCVRTREAWSAHPRRFSVGGLSSFALFNVFRSLSACARDEYKKNNNT